MIYSQCRVHTVVYIFNDVNINVPNDVNINVPPLQRYDGKTTLLICFYPHYPHKNAIFTFKDIDEKTSYIIRGTSDSSTIKDFSHSNIQGRVSWA